MKNRTLTECELDIVEDVVGDYCMHCPEDTLDDDTICEKCHIRNFVDMARENAENKLTIKATKRQLFDTLSQMLNSPCIDDEDETLDKFVDVDKFVKDMADTLKALIEV